MGGHRAAAATIANVEKKISPRKLLQQRKSELVQSQSPAALMFHCSGVTCKQWRELRNDLAPVQGAVLFQPNFKGKCSKKSSEQPNEQFPAKVAASSGPMCMLYLKEGSPDGKWSKLQPSDSLSQNMVLLYGKHRSDVLNHMDLKKVTTLDVASVYQKGIFSTFFHPMGFLSGLDKLKAAIKNEDLEGGVESKDKVEGD